MNHGDTFILDVRSHIFVWTGKDSNRMERLQASKVCRGNSYSDSHATFASKFLPCKASFHTFFSLPQSAQKIKEENGGGTIVTVGDGEEGSLEADEMEALEAFLPMAQKQQVGAKCESK